MKANPILFICGCLGGLFLIIIITANTSNIQVNHLALTVGDIMHKNHQHGLMYIYFVVILTSYFWCSRT